MAGKSKKKRNVLSLLRTAEFLLVNGTKYAVAMSYVPRETPVVVAKGRGKSASDLIWSAQEMGIPIIESSNVDLDFYKLAKENREIPEPLYETTASALAFLYRSPEEPHFVRFVKPLRTRPSLLSLNSGELVRRYDSALDVSLVSLSLGSALYEMVDTLREPLDLLRHKIAMEIGIVIPEISVTPSGKLTPFQYHLCLRDTPCFFGEVEETAYEPVDFVSQLINRLKQLISKNAWQLLGYVETSALVERIAEKNKVLCDAVFSRGFSLPALRYILINLLREGIPIRDLTRILEIIRDHREITTDPDILTEYVRSYFAYVIWHKFSDESGIMNALFLSPEMEHKLSFSIKKLESVSIFELEELELFNFLESLKSILDKCRSMGLNPVLMVSPHIRRFVRRLIASSFPDLGVISYSEIQTSADVLSVGIVG